MLKKIYLQGRLVDLKPNSETLATSLGRLQNRILLNLTETTEDKLWNLIDLLKKQKVIILVDGKHLIIHNLSQQDMADYVGVSRQMLYLTMKKLTNENSVKFSRGKITY